MLVFTAAPGSASHDGLQLLANWVITRAQADAIDSIGQIPLERDAGTISYD